METRQFDFNTHKHTHTHTHAYARQQTNTLARIQLNDFNPAKSHFPARIFFLLPAYQIIAKKDFINNICQNERKRNRSSRKKREREKKLQQRIPIF